MRKSLAALAAALALGGPGLAAAAEAPVVQVTGGAVRGEIAAGGHAVFRGLPFAAPPLAALRWRPPQPVRPWPGVRAATGQPPACLQADVGWNKADAARSAEDCLYLNVATPSLRPGARLPVMVWIHGGANWAGSAGGADSSIVGKGVVLVSIQYRLGVFGFLSHPALTAEGRGASGNYGLMDQIAALQWIRANIARFGGDADNVTLFGESAGAQDIGQLMLSPLTGDLFARAIQESGTAGFGLAPRSLAENEALGGQFAAKVGAPGGAAGVAVLRTLPGDRLLAAQMTLHGPEGLPNDSFVWLQAVTDGRVLPAPPAVLIAARRPLRPVILGSNAREIAFYGLDGLEAQVARTYGARGVVALAALGGPAATDARLGDAAVQIATDAMFRCPAAWTARTATAGGGAVWQYQFDVADAAGVVTHASELPFVFDARPVAPGVSLQAYWVNFARTGDPNGPGLPAWPRYGAERAYLAFDPTGPRVGENLRGEVCDLLGRP